MTEKTENENESVYLLPQQLRVGIYVFLDLGWMEHPFPFSSFKIRSEEQIRKIRALGLPRIRYSPERSDQQPLPVPVNLGIAPLPPSKQSAAPLTPPVAKPAEAVDPEVTAKRERVAALARRREKASLCEKLFLSAAKVVKDLERLLHSQPQKTAEMANSLVSQMVSSLLTEADVAVTLMNDRVGGEEVYYHSLNVAVLSMILAKELGLDADTVQAIGVGALFHDIGKTEIPNRVLLKIDPLTPAEVALMREHVNFGTKLVQKLPLSPLVRDVVEQHHEYIDGTGFPRRLTSDAIAEAAKVVALVNEYDNLCNPMDVAKAMTPHEALSHIYAQKRGKFSPAALQVFIKSMGVYPPGTVVVLSNGMPGIVVSVNASRPLKPVVLVYDPGVPKEEAIVLDLELEPDLAIEKTLRPSQLPRAVYEYLSPRRRVTYYFDQAAAAAPKP